MNTTKKQNNKVNKNLAVAITCPPARPSLARAQQRAFALLLFLFLLSFNVKHWQNESKKRIGIQLLSVATDLSTSTVLSRKKVRPRAFFLVPFSFPAKEKVTSTGCG
ncbi:hypothetical protein [Mucilaginibacter lacusdianchii]|uniref:hypothetical protein n=1 Tax=Mucilaginibacter lacusdianchii TaxID=2684211 RepID=UPI00131CFB7B|nr:hypothetical protein [Mucilaginibacter sp. JXJ CY 39]